MHRLSSMADLLLFLSCFIFQASSLSLARLLRVKWAQVESSLPSSAPVVFRQSHSRLTLTTNSQLVCRIGNQTILSFLSLRLAMALSSITFGGPLPASGRSYDSTLCSKTSRTRVARYQADRVSCAFLSLSKSSYSTHQHRW